MDRILNQITKNIQSLSNDDLSGKAFAMFEEFKDQPNLKENVYTSKFNNTMRETHTYNGYANRMLYSQQSKVLSIHYYQNVSYGVDKKFP